MFGALVETFVVNEIAAQAGWSGGYVLRHWRDTSRKLEVDLVVDPDGVPTPIEVKAGRDVRPDDLAGLRRFLDTVPAARRGIVFPTGEHLLPVADRIWAVPVSALWTPYAGRRHG